MLKDIEDSSQTRRLQQSGGSTYIISLPKKWIEELKVKAGEHMTIVKNSNQSLTLFPGDAEQITEKSKAIIKTSQKDSSESIKRKIIAAYLGGYKTIQIKSKGVRIQSEHARAIRALVRTTMIGTEIVESSSETIVIQVLTRLPELSFETALKRMYLMAVNMHKEAIESFSEGDIAHSEEIINMDDEVDRFSLYMRRNLAISIENARILEEMGLKKASDCLGYRAVITRIERIADHAVLIAKRVKFIEGKIDSKILKKIMIISEQSLQIFKDAVNALENKDYQMAEDVASKVKNIIEKEKSIMSEIKDTTKNSSVIRFVLEDIRRVVEYSSDISEVAIDENIDSVIIIKN